MKSVHTALLADPIHPADALLEPHRIPWQLQVDDDPTAVVEIQSFSSRTRGEQYPTSGEASQGGPALAAGEPLETYKPWGHSLDGVEASPEIVRKVQLALAIGARDRALHVGS